MKRIGIGLVATPVLLVLALAAVLQTSAFKAWLKDTAIDAAEDALNARLHVGRVDGTLLTSLELEDLRLTDLDGAPIATIARAEASYGVPLRAIGGTLVVDRVALSGVELHVEADEDGVLNLTKLLKPSPPDDAPPPAFRIALPQLVVDGKIGWVDRARGGNLGGLDAGAVSLEPSPENAGNHAVIDALHIEARADLELDGTLSAAVDVLDADAAVGHVARSPLKIRDLRWAMDATGKTTASLGALALDGVALSSLKAEIEAGEDAKLAANVGELRVEPELADMLKRLDIAYVPRVPIGVKAAVEGSLDAPEVDATISTAEHGSVALEANLSDLASPAKLGFEAWLKADRLEPHLWIDGVALPTMNLNLVAKVAGKGIEPASMQAEASLAVENSEIDVYRIQLARLGLAIDDGVVKVDTLELDTPYAGAKGSGSFGLDSGEFTIDLEATSDDELARVTQGIFKDDTVVEGKIVGDGRLALGAEDPTAMIERVDLDVSWKLEDFQAEDVSVDATSGSLSLEVVPTTNDGRSRRATFDIDANVRRLKAKEIRISRAQLDSTGSVVYTPPVDGLEDILNRARLRAEGDASDVHVPGVVSLSSGDLDATITSDGSRSYRYDIDARVQRLDAPGAVKANRVDADLRGQVVFNRDATPRRLAAKGVIEVDALDAGGQNVGAATVKLDVAGPTRKLQGSVVVDARDTRVATYDFASVHADVMLEEERRFRVAVDGKQKEQQPADIALEVVGTYSEGLDDFTVDDVQLKTSGSSWIIENGLSASTSDGTYQFRDLKLTHGDDQKLTIDGTFRQGRDQDLNVTIENLRVQELNEEFGLGLPPIEARVSGDIQLQGTARKPSGQVNLTLTDVYYDGYGPFEIHLRAYYEDESFYISDLSVRAYEADVLELTAVLPLRFTTTGEFEVRPDGDISVLASIPSVNFKPFYGVVPALADYMASGALSGEITFFGTVDEPYLEANLAIADAAVIYPMSDGSDMTIGPVGASASLRYEPPTDSSGGIESSIAFRDRNGDGFQAKLGAQIPLAKWVRGVADGKFDAVKLDDWLNSPFDLLVLLPSYDLAKVNISAMRDAKAEGRLDMYVSGDGTLGRPEAVVRAKLSHFGWDRFRDIYIDFDAQLEEDQLRLRNLAVEWDADDIFSAKATIPVPLRALLGKASLEDLPVNGQITLHELPIAKLSAVDYTFAAVKGTMAADIQLDGRLSKPRVSAHTQLKEVLFANRKTGSFAFDFSAQANRLVTNATLTHGERDVLSMSMAGPVNLDILSLAQGEDALREGALKASIIANDLDVAGAVPARVLRNVFTNLEGKLNSDMSITGTWANPNFSGKFDLRGFAAFFPQLGRTINEGNISLVAENNALKIVELYAREDQGYLDADGTVNFDGIRPQNAQLNVSLSDLNTSGFTPLPTYVSGSADIGADFTEDIVDSRIALRDLNIAIPKSAQTGAHPMELSPDIEILTRNERQAGLLELGAVDSAMGARSQLARVQVEISPNSWVRHPNADIQFKGELAIDVGTNDTIIFGDLTTIEGELEFLGKQFAMQQGIVTFAGSTPPNPRIQVEAKYNLDRSISEAMGPATGGQPTATVRVTGTARKPLLRLSSDPQMTESQIIYVLVSDRPPTTAESGEEEGVASQAVAAASGLLSGMLKQRAKQYYPIDTLKLKADAEGISGVEVGKYFGKNLFFAYEYQFAAEEGENTSEFRVEYRLDFAPDWLVGTRFGDQANGAVFIYWDIL